MTEKNSFTERLLISPLLLRWVLQAVVDNRLLVGSCVTLIPLVMLKCLIGPRLSSLEIFSELS